MDGTVLVADDDRTIRTVLTQALTRAGCRVHATSSLITLMRWVEEGKGDLIISDVVMPDGNGLDTLPRITERRPGLPVIIISAQNTIKTAIQAMESEAYDYLPKPFDLPDLMKRAARALDVKRRINPPAPANDLAPPLHEDLPLVGRTAVMQALYRLVARVINIDLTVLITGESGTGKSLIARVIHDFSDRRGLPFIVVEPRDLDGPDGAPTIMARAKSGSILFDEVGDLDHDAQGKVVRMLDTVADMPPRIMASSQKDLTEKMEAGAFRQDLFYRLGGVTIPVPSLRERVEDIPLLTHHFMARTERDSISARRLSPKAMEIIRAYSWPGNVRQLENTIRRLAFTSQIEEIGISDVENVLSHEPAIEAVTNHLRRYFDLHGGVLPPPGLHARILREIEKPLIEITLEATGGNQAKCADLLGINRNTLRKKITDLDIRVTRRRKLM